MRTPMGRMATAVKICTGTARKSAAWTGKLSGTNQRALSLIEPPNRCRGFNYDCHVPCGHLSFFTGYTPNLEQMEARPGVEPGWTDLQSGA